MLREAFCLLIVSITACSESIYQQQHAAAMRHHVYVSDMEQYGVDDYWTQSLTGDCEDYALWMQERVGGQLLYVITESKDAHVNLVGVGGVWIAG